MGKILIKNGKVVSTEWIRKCDVLINGEKIELVADKIACKDAKVIDAKGKYVLPGLIDSHTHYSLISRGTVTADDFVNGSKVAAFGGCTTVIDFADNEKGKRLSQSACDRIEAMKKGMGVDFALHQGVYRVDEDIEKQLCELEESGVCVLKIFTTYRNVGYLIENKNDLEKLFRLAKKKNMLITAHCEDNQIIEDTDASYKGDFSPSSHAVLRPDTAEAVAIRTLGSIAKKVGTSLYIVHLSSFAGLKEVRVLRRKGVKVYAETTPTYLFKEKSMLERPDGAQFIMTPPLRTQKDNRELINALKNAEIDVVATDHCAFTKEQKISSSADCRTTYPGVPGTQEMFSSLSTYCTTGANKLSLTNLVALTSTNPARIFGLYPKKGLIAPGADADVVIFDLKEKWKPCDNVVSSSGYTLFDTDEFTGRVVTTILRGNIIMDEGKYYPISGKFLEENRKV